MDNWRVDRLVILAGGLGLVGVFALATAFEPLEMGSLALSLLLLALATWHLWRWGLGKLVAIGLLALGALERNLFDFGAGSPLWEQGYTGAELVVRWVMAGSAAVVMIGVLWSLAALYQREGQEVAASLAWWRRWGVLAGGIAVALVIGWQVRAAIQDEDASPIAIGDEGDDGHELEDEWSILTSLGDEGDTLYQVHMIRTFSPLDAGAVEDLGGRLIWPETEIELCGVEILSEGEGLVQIGNYFPAREECAPIMERAFDEYGLPETACLWARSDGVDDEYCAPLELD